MTRVVALVFFALFASAAQAYPASGAVTWKCNAGAEFSSASAALSSCTGDYDPAYQVAVGVAQPTPSTGAFGAYGGAYSMTPTPNTTEGSWQIVGNVIFNDPTSGVKYRDNSKVVYSLTSTTLSCPGGGTLSGSTCTCPAGYTDTGTACEAPTCPASQFHDGTACVDKCPAAGTAWSETDHTYSAWEGGVSFRKGSAYACQPSFYGTAPSGTASCQVENTSMVSVCDGDTCWAENARYTGVMCGSETGTVPTVDPGANKTPTVCEEGDLWCKSATGTCGTGYTAGSVNNTTICAKVGEGISITPQPQSANAPPITPSPQPSSWSSPSARPGESINPSMRVVVSIGSSATAFPGTAGGGAGGAGGPDLECGLPGMPACKIDETGTPTGSGAYGTASGALDGTVTGLEGVADGIESGEGKDTGWKIGFSPPTGCTNPSVTLPAIGTWEADMCQHAGTIGGVMSFLWYLLTLGSCLSMIRSTMTGGTA